MQTKNITCIICKATSSFDTVLPLINYCLVHKPNVRWTIIIWNPSREKVLQGSQFYEQYIIDKNISNYDLIELVMKNRFLAKVVRRTLFASKKGRFIGYFLKFLQALIMIRLSTTNSESILAKFNPNLILLDHRSLKKDPWNLDLREYLGKSKIPVVLMPHAPHHTGTEAFSPFLGSNPLPPRFSYWMPFKFDAYWAKLPDQKNQFFWSGYPGFDSSWLQSHARLKNVATKPKILFIIRKFFPPNIKKIPDGHDAYAFLYPEFEQYLKIVYRQTQEEFGDCIFAIKPHPSTSRKLLKNLIWKIDSKQSNIIIEDESIYSLMAQYDIFISLYSTTLLFPALIGKPTIIIHTRIQDEIEKWEKLKELYRGLSLFSVDLDHFQDNIQRANKVYLSKKSILEDISHVRRYFPDNASQKCYKRMQLLMEKA